MRPSAAKKGLKAWQKIPCIQVVNSALKKMADQIEANADRERKERFPRISYSKYND